MQTVNPKWIKLVCCVFPFALLFTASCIRLAQAQTLQETVDFIGEGLRNVNGVIIPVTHTISIQNCVVTVSGTFDEADQFESLDGQTVTAIIDFNKVIASSGNWKDTSVGIIPVQYIAFDGEGSVQTTGWSLQTMLMSGLSNGNPDAVSKTWDSASFGYTDFSQRKVDAFKYFVSSFCRGSKSAF